MGLRSKDVSQGCEFTFSDVTVPAGDPRSLTASFEIAKLEASCKGTASGDAMEGVLRISLRDSSARAEIVARTPENTTAIYYKQADDAKVQVGCDDDKNQAKLDKPVTLTYPRRVERAFPGFSRDTAEPAAQVSGFKKGFEFEVKPEGWVDGDPLAYKLTVVAKAGELGNDAKLEFKLKDSVVKGLVLAKASCKLVKSSN